MRPKPPLLDLNLAGCSCMLSNRTHHLVWFSASLQSLLTLASSSGPGSLRVRLRAASGSPSQAPSQAPLFPTPVVSAPSESGSEPGQVCYSAKSHGLRP
jgi:hypothetical protein